jgi:glyceraldehyde-3-phosphate dehydrogenase (NADP+)
MERTDFFQDASDGGVYKYFVDGAYQASHSGEVIDITNPYTGDVLGQVQAVTREEVDAAIDSAWVQFPCWRDTSMLERAKVLHAAARILEEQADYLAEIMCNEIAKPVKDSKKEVLRTAEYFDFTAEDALRLEGETKFGDAFAGFKRETIIMDYRVPLGVILAIGPFNYPINLLGTKIAPALATGNACIVKPPTAGSISALHFGEIMKRAGLPPGVLSILTGRGSEIGDYLVAHEKISMIAFTGSSATGKHISTIAGMKPLLLELGGKDAALVLPDADLKETASQIVSGAFSYSGQRCTAVKRVLAFEKIVGELVPMLMEKVRALPVGDPHDDVAVSALITPAACDYVQGLIDDALDKGATLVCGNQREGNVLWPTLLDNVTTEMRVAWEEPFGPVLPVIRVTSIEEAVDIANRSEYGLQSSIFTNDINSAINVSMQLDVGTVQINSKTQRGPDHFPFMGTKSSGLGVQGSRYAIEAMSRAKAIVINLSEKGKVQQACSMPR